MVAMYIRETFAAKRNLRRPSQSRLFSFRGKRGQTAEASRKAATTASVVSYTTSGELDPSSTCSMVFHQRYYAFHWSEHRKRQHEMLSNNSSSIVVLVFLKVLIRRRSKSLIDKVGHKSFIQLSKSC